MLRYVQNLQCQPLQGERSPAVNRVVAAIALVLTTLPLGLASNMVVDNRVDTSTVR